MAHEEQQPMSDARLAEIRERGKLFQRGTTSKSLWNMPQIVQRDAIDLLAEVERLRAREAALLEIVQAVADSRLTVLPYEQGALVMPPHIINHQLREQARALLASDSQS